ncbi:hypothetical protein IMY05_002G0132800 [Salix suchowensis]|nr:hypothetical protein IMY05_002G0132800 [Salix suchowensis]
MDTYCCCWRTRWDEEARAVIRKGIEGASNKEGDEDVLSLDLDQEDFQVHCTGVDQKYKKQIGGGGNNRD